MRIQVVTLFPELVAAVAASGVVARAAERGVFELGTWNPFFQRGYPHHAEGQSGILHPFHLIVYYIFPVALAVFLEVALCLPFAFFGMYVFLGSFKIEGIPRLLGAALFIFSSYMSMHFMHVNMIWVYAHLPWVLWCCKESVDQESYRYWALGLYLLFVSMILFGHPQQCYFNGLALLIFYTLYYLQQKDKARCRRRGLIISAFLFCAMLTGMLQMLPTYDYLQKSPRKEVKKEDYFNYSQPPSSFLAFFNPPSGGP